MSEKSLELRVGLLVLVALVLLGAFVFVLGGFELGGGFTVYADFDNPGNVKVGAPVLIGGMDVGRVDRIEFRGNAIDPKTGRRKLIRLHLRLQERVRETLHEDAMFYISARNILGEQVVSIDPGSPNRPRLQEGAVVEGVDPPRLDEALALGFELLEGLVKLLRTHGERIKRLLEAASRVLEGVAEIMDEHGERIDRILVNVEKTTEEAARLSEAARGYVEGPEVRRIVRNLDRSLAAVDRDLGPLLQDARSVASRADETLAAIGPEEREQLRKALREAGQLVERASRIAADAEAITGRIRRGEGTAGRFTADDSVYDDLQELLRDLKHNPWKLFWRE